MGRGRKREREFGFNNNIKAELICSDVIMMVAQFQLRLRPFLHLSKSGCVFLLVCVAVYSEGKEVFDPMLSLCSDKETEVGVS